MAQPNPTTCGTENPPDAEFCRSCGLPLTRSAGEKLRERDEARVEDGVFGIVDADGGAKPEGRPR